MLIALVWYKHPLEQYNKSYYFELTCPLKHEGLFQDNLFIAFYVQFSELK